MRERIAEEERGCEVRGKLRGDPGRKEIRRSKKKKKKKKKRQKKKKKKKLVEEGEGREANGKGKRKISYLGVIPT